ncbi:MAG: hypothetical protein ACK4NC_03415 [Candidatus Gracilibacteria bacterium]
MANLRNKLIILCSFSFLLFSCAVIYIDSTYAQTTVAIDADRDGFDDASDDKCPGQYGMIQGCFQYSEALNTSNTQLTRSDIVIPPCTSPAGCACTAVQDQQMLEKGDALLIQIKGTPHVSAPFEVK